MPEIWQPGVAAPSDDLVARIHREIGRFTEKRGIPAAVVVVELHGGSRFAVDAISPEPGYGFFTICPHPDEDVPGEVIVPVGGIARIELHASAEEEPKLGFSLPEAAQAKNAG
ncbi:MAG: hypothetical protein M3123_03600 [Actinomycetota bacterium]|nr:hypothetical protein [Actinomycetota bacterium]